MPNRCFVPNCKTGYPGNKPTCELSLFAPPKDEALFKQWEQYIPRKDTKLKPSSRVCSRHFEEDDIIKGRMIKGKDGKEIIHAWKHWTLKEGAIPRIFQDCPSHLSKPKPVKRKVPLDRQTADNRKRKNAKHMDEPREHTGDVLQNFEGMPWWSFNPKDCLLPPAWFWINSKDESAVPLCVQFVLIPGKTTESKSVHLKEGQVFLSYNSKVLYSTFLNQEQNDETLCQQLTRIMKDFDQAHICQGIREKKFANIKFCAGAVLEDDTWRSGRCKTIFDGNNENPRA